MSSVSFNRKRVKLKQLLGIRARLALLAVILVAPLMLERARSLEDNRARQLAQASQDFANLARHSADTQREVISSVQTVLKSAAYIRASAGGLMRTCDILRASVPANMPWIRNLLLVGSDGRVQCSTGTSYVGLYLGDRPYLKKAQETREFVVSDFLLARGSNNAVVMAAYPVSAINPDSDAIMLASMSLDWMSKLMSNLGGRAGISAVLIDSAGTVLATPPDQKSQIGKSIDEVPLLSAMADRALNSDRDEGSLGLRRRRRLQAYRQLPSHCRHRHAPARQHRRGQDHRGDQERDPHRLSAACLRLPLCSSWRPHRRREADHQADRPHGLDGQALRPGRPFGARRAQPPAVRIRAAGARLQRDGCAAQPARERAGRDQRPSHRDRLHRHAVGPRQPPRLPKPARFRMAEGAAI